MPHTCTATSGPRFTTGNHLLQPLSGAPAYLHYTALASASSCGRSLFKLGDLPQLYVCSPLLLLSPDSLASWGATDSHVLRAGQAFPREKMPFSGTFFRYVLKRYLLFQDPKKISKNVKCKKAKTHSSFFVPAHAGHTLCVFVSTCKWIFTWPWEHADHIRDSVLGAIGYLTCISKKQNSSVIPETQLII